MKRHNGKAAFLLLCFMAVGVLMAISLTCISAKAETNGYKISGYIDPDLSYSNQDLKSGFRVELIGTQLQSVSGSDGYFEISGIPVNSTDYTVKISKEGYLYRQITGVKVTNNLKFGSQSDPVKMWAGDMPVNGAQDNAINMSDIMEVANHFNSVSGVEKYSVLSDFNRDSAVNMTDIMVVAKHFNQIPSAYPLIEITIDNPAGLQVSFIDVGKADSIFIKTPGGKSMLIDAGKSTDAASVISYIKNEGVSKLDVVVGTHPHDDHIGGMSTVINSLDVGKIYLPKVATSIQVLNDVLSAVKNKGLAADTAKAGVSIDLDPDLKVVMLAPKSDSYQSINDYSAVIKLTYKNTSFLLSGDANTLSEGEMLDAGYDLKADVLKVGHHGSSGATTANYLKAVCPKFAVISVGTNSSGYPAKATLDKLAAANVQVYRTDLNGTITAKSDGSTIAFE